MKILKSGIEMTPGELIASKAGKACACSCQGGADTNDFHSIGAEQSACFCGCLDSEEIYLGSRNYPRDYPY
jgi:hypothetical protein